ncbi:hypothetical protein NDN08_005867 [Rhodosorus marinus]|uniref:Mediator of RNA polymerase II transcription subunit 11 n=1 Tax=Rhodosorus marinus TaxID=101924 RepID=A0AAV8V3Y3_9RHOD|nr:hypothetical protein NDN08_005867 [Rhodosorus marinus]
MAATTNKVTTTSKDEKISYPFPVANYLNDARVGLVNKLKQTQEQMSTHHKESSDQAVSTHASESHAKEFGRWIDQQIHEINVGIDKKAESIADHKIPAYEIVNFGGQQDIPEPMSKVVDNTIKDLQKGLDDIAENEAAAQAKQRNVIQPK